MVIYNCLWPKSHQLSSEILNSSLLGGSFTGVLNISFFIRSSK